MVSHDVIGFYLLSQEVHKHVKVVQSGQGADEIFAGYRWYPPLLDEPGRRLACSAYSELFFDRDHAAYGEAVADRFVREDYTHGVRARALRARRAPAAPSTARCASTPR